MNAAECRARAAELRAFGRLHKKYRDEAERIALRFEAMAAYVERGSATGARMASAVEGRDDSGPGLDGQSA